MEDLIMKKLVFVFLTVIFLNSCFTLRKHSVHFTGEIRKKMYLNNINIKKAQFFIDRKVELKRKDYLSEFSLDNKGIFDLDNTNLNNIVIIEQYQPGICISDGVKLGIAFEEDNNKLLYFGTTARSTSDTNNYDAATTSFVKKLFFGKDTTLNNDSIYAIESHKNEVNYNDTIYILQSGGYNAKLMIKVRCRDTTITKKRKVPGRTIQ